MVDTYKVLLTSAAIAAAMSAAQPIGSASTLTVTNEPTLVHTNIPSSSPDGTLGGRGEAYQDEEVSLPKRTTRNGNDKSMYSQAGNLTEGLTWT